MWAMCRKKLGLASKKEALKIVSFDDGGFRGLEQSDGGLIDLNCACSRHFHAARITGVADYDLRFF